MLQNVFLMITMMSIMIPRASVAAKRINEVMDTKISICDRENTQDIQQDKKGPVVFDHVGIAYPGADEGTLHDISFTANPGETVAFIGSTGSGKSTLVNLIPRFFDVPGADEGTLHDISFTANPGETVAFIGSTGSGKSTLVNLIPRFFDVTKGQILVDGTDVKDLKLHDLRSRIGYVPQKAVLFSGTIDSNIRYGREEATKEEVEKAAKIAQAWEFIQEKEDGVQEAIAQGGTNVSGGQKQRLSIARAVAKNPEIYIFDDSFSALDYKTDVVLRRALKMFQADKSSVFLLQEQWQKILKSIFLMTVFLPWIIRRM